MTSGVTRIAPLRRWYGIMFAVIAIADATASITTDFAGGVSGRLAGHTFLVAGFLSVLLALLVLLAPPLLTAINTHQRFPPSRGIRRGLTPARGGGAAGERIQTPKQLAAQTANGRKLPGGAA